jgi:hypothetical protein
MLLISFPTRVIDWYYFRVKKMVLDFFLLDFSGEFQHHPPPATAIGQYRHRG